MGLGNIKSIFKIRVVNGGLIRCDAMPNRKGWFSNDANKLVDYQPISLSPSWTGSRKRSGPNTVVLTRGMKRFRFDDRRCLDFPEGVISECKYDGCIFERASHKIM